MTSNRYVVLNCPALMGNRLCYSKEIRQCADCTDCVIKQVIDMCRDEMRFDRKSELALATDINSFFDIEEINK